jgi:hypothetical protein
MTNEPMTSKPMTNDQSPITNHQWILLQQINFFHYIDQTAAVTKFVIVPAHHFYQIANNRG